MWYRTEFIKMCRCALVSPQMLFGWRQKCAMLIANHLSSADESFYIYILCSCYRTMPSAVWEIFSEFLIFCNLFHEPLGEWNNSKIWETRKIFANIVQGSAITTLSLNACLNKMYQELSYLLIVSGLLNII